MNANVDLLAEFYDQDQYGDIDKYISNMSVESQW